MGVEFLGHVGTVQTSEEPLDGFAEKLHHFIHSPLAVVVSTPFSPHSCQGLQSCLLPFVWSLPSPCCVLSRVSPVKGMPIPKNSQTAYWDDWLLHFEGVKLKSQLLYGFFRANRDEN